MSSENARLTFLLETVTLESAKLMQTDVRLFALPFTADRAAALRQDQTESERTDAFVARFGRLQDTLGDKLLPELLRCLAENVGPAIDNLDRAEKLGLLASADNWLGKRAGCVTVWCTNMCAIPLSWPKPSTRATSWYRYCVALRKPSPSIARAVG